MAKQNFIPFDVSTSDSDSVSVAKESSDASGGRFLP
jgi:hypothetical protein